ncbi:MAG: hypothetical protein JWM63_2149 [Gammaproteobacteria bacterium]|nr:hypothetical protein [Gammaproteobacteria bacterium]
MKYLLDTDAFSDIVRGVPARGLIVVTGNTREFSRVPGLQIENWRLAPSEVRETPGEYRVVRVAQTRITLAA